MTASNQRQDSTSKSGEDAFAESASLSKKLITAMLVRMIESAGSYHGWSLSDQDGARMVKLIKHKQRIICSAFWFQMKKHFSEFKSSTQTPSKGKAAADWQHLGLSGATEKVEIDELKAITSRYSEAFEEFDHAILKRLQTCIKKSRANIHQNPLQVKRLCESFQYAIDSLNLEVNYKIALYHLFADRFIEALGPTYRRIDQSLFDAGIQPKIPVARIHLRSIDGLSESKSPKSFKPNQSACLLVLLQRFKEKSRQASSSYKNLFPELKQRFATFELNEYDKQIEQLNQMFKLIFEDEDLPSPVKQQLARLQIYVFITAVQEDGFLRRSSNPARRLLDGIIGSEVEIAKSGNSEFSGIRFIREHIDGMANHGFITVDSYSEMLKGYQVYVKENETSIRKSRKLEATKKVMPLVTTSLSDLTAPLKIQGTRLILFEKVWLPLMVQIALRQGMDSDPWHKVIAMVKKQVWSLIPKSNLEDQEKLQKVLPQVAHSLHRAMRSLKLAESLQQSLRDYLKLEQQNVVEETARNIIEAKRKTRSLSAQSFAPVEEDTTEFDEMMQTGIFQIPAEMADAFKTVKPDKPKKISQVDALSTGEWVNMKLGGTKMLVKLAWKAEDSSLFIFVDRDGKRICELDATKLTQQFESGDISLMDSGSADSEKTQFSFMKSL
ncbi:MAG: DUF1631 domain-containing protein [Gammaproteobacteria bacterium]|nr:DUF1631 domain-containing protein [Gammaproteobacteria bacterium]